GRGQLPGEAVAPGRGPLEEVRVDRRDQGPLSRTGAQAAAEDHPAHAEAPQAVRPRIADRLDPSVRLDEWRLDEELGEHFFRPLRVARHALPLREDLTVLRLEIQEKVTHLPSELVRL